MASAQSHGTSGASGAAIGRHVVFWVGQRCLAMPIDVVREVVDLQRITPVPMAPPAVVGIVSLRGTILSVLDAEFLFAGKHRESAITKALVLVRGGVVVSGLAVDRVHGVVSVSATEVLRDHAVHHEPFILGHHDLGIGHLVAVLDVDSLFAHVESQRFGLRSEHAAVPLD